MILSLIVAIGNNNEIGKDNQLLWHLPADMQRFKEITTGHTIVMGRKTFDSLPNGPLPNRQNIVISRDLTLSKRMRKLFVIHAVKPALLDLTNEKEVFIIGGAQIYEQTIEDADKLYLTQVHADFPEADTFFPPINYQEWREISRESFPADEKHPYPFTFLELERWRR